MSNLEIIRLASISQASNSLKINSQFQTRARRNDNDKYFLHGQQRNVEVLAGAFERSNELMVASYADEKQSGSAMKKANHHNKKCYGISVAKHVQLKDKYQRSSAPARITGVEYAPLLLRNSQLGNAHDDQRELSLDKLELIGIDASEK